MKLWAVFIVTDNGDYIPQEYCGAMCIYSTRKDARTRAAEENDRNHIARVQQLEVLGGGE